MRYYFWELPFSGATALSWPIVERGLKGPDRLISYTRGLTLEQASRKGIVGDNLIF